MYFREDTQTAANLLKQAIPLMVKRNIPTNPCNFALWYAYAADRDSDLKQALEQTFPESQPYEPEKGEQLFFDYFVKSYLPNHESAQDTMVSLLTGLFSSAQVTAEGTREYGQSLQQGLDKIKGDASPEELEKTLESLLQDTEAADALTQQFHSELSSAKEEIELLKQRLKDTEKSAFVDSLTKIGNRRSFDQAMAAAMADPQYQPCLLLIDLDHFKKFNDTYGHLIGDRVLSAMGQLLKTFEKEDVHVARYGGEEFAVIVKRGMAAGAVELAEAIRAKVTKIRIKQQEQDIDTITTSIGVTQFRGGEDVASFIQRADKALYSAKQNGRDQVQSA